MVNQRLFYLRVVRLPVGEKKRTRHSIPIQERAYLLTLKNDIEEKYPRVYEDYLNIYPQETAKAREKDAMVKDLQTRITKTEEKLERIESLIKDALKETT